MSPRKPPSQLRQTDLLWLTTNAVYGKFASVVSSTPALTFDPPKDTPKLTLDPSRFPTLPETEASASNPFSEPRRGLGRALSPSRYLEPKPT